MIMRLLEFTDSAFPVGTFSFSSGLETACACGIVHDASTLEHYTHAVMHQAAFTDGIAALCAARGYRCGSYEAVLDSDAQTVLCKMNYEARLMTCRMGKKMAELSSRIFEDGTVSRWMDDVNAGRTPGTYPVAQGLVFAACGIPEFELFCAHQYGVASMVLGAALRLVRVSHYQTQSIMFSLGDVVAGLYEQVRDMTLEDMNAFVPQIDILASLHEKGTQRMFMN